MILSIELVSSPVANYVVLLNVRYVTYTGPVSLVTDFMDNHDPFCLFGPSCVGNFPWSD